MYDGVMRGGGRGLTTVAGILSVLALTAVAVTPAMATTKRCANHTGRLAHDASGLVWHTSTTLYACSNLGGPPRRWRLGPWKRGTRVYFAGVLVTWIVPTTVDGEEQDAVWAGHVDERRIWLKGVPAVPKQGSDPARPAHITRFLFRGNLVWVTATGDVVMAVDSPGDDPVAQGALPAPLEVVGKHLVRVGSWPGADPVALARSLRYLEMGSDGDECGGYNSFGVRVRPDPAGPLVGANWSDYFYVPGCG